MLIHDAESAAGAYQCDEVKTLVLMKKGLHDAFQFIAAFLIDLWCVIHIGIDVCSLCSISKS